MHDSTPGAPPRQEPHARPDGGLLKRIDPDGTLTATALNRWPLRYESAAEVLGMMVNILAERGLLGFPDEPKLDVSALRVLWISQNLTGFRHIAPCEQSLYTAYVRRDDVEKLRANEPSLAEIREKVEGLRDGWLRTRDASVDHPCGSDVYGMLTGWAGACDSVLALLEQPKPEPKKRYVYEEGMCEWIVRDTTYGPGAGIKSRSDDEHDARRIADALNATIITVAGRPLADVQAEVPT